MLKKLFLLFCFLSLTTLSFAHSGRLDSSGGHRVNKGWIYDGQYIEIENNIPHLERGLLIFKEGDYHYHCKPSENKIDIITYRDGIYLPVPEKEIKNNTTSNIKISSENRVASKESNVYHNSDCQYIKNIKEENIIIFEDKEDAERNDYTPCKVCHPEKIEVAQ